MLYLSTLLMHAQDCIEETYRTVFLNTGHSDTVSTVAFSSDGNLLACGSFDGQINVWSTATRSLQGTLEGSGSGFEVRWSLTQLISSVNPLLSLHKIQRYLMFSLIG